MTTDAYEYRITYVPQGSESLERLGGFTREVDARTQAHGLIAQGARDVRLWWRPRPSHWTRFAQSEFPGGGGRDLS